MFDGKPKTGKGTAETELLGPSETYATYLNYLTNNKNFGTLTTSDTAPAGLTEMAMYLDVFGPMPT